MEWGHVLGRVLEDCRFVTEKGIEDIYWNIEG